MADKRFKIKEIEIDDYNVECADAKLVITDNDEVVTNEQAVDLLNELIFENENNKRVLKDFMLLLNRIQYYFKDDNLEWENNDKLELLRLIRMGRDMLQNMDEELLE